MSLPEGARLTVPPELPPPYEAKTLWFPYYPSILLIFNFYLKEFSVKYMRTDLTCAFLPKLNRAGTEKRCRSTWDLSPEHRFPTSHCAPGPPIASVLYKGTESIKIQYPSPNCTNFQSPSHPCLKMFPFVSAWYGLVAKVLTNEKWDTTSVAS